LMPTSTSSSSSNNHLHSSSSTVALATGEVLACVRDGSRQVIDVDTALPTRKRLYWLPPGQVC
jgi:hypothetical protein